MSLAAKHGDVGGLDLAGLGDLAAMLDGAQPQTREPGMYDISRIHEDERNSRGEDNPGYSEESIRELAESFKRRERQGKRGRSPILRLCRALRILILMTWTKSSRTCSARI